ncbi:hypothetical protein X975_19185, partial [Stegodyphus mimosarum]
MQAQDVAEVSKDDTKSLSEWPTLGEVHMNEKQAASSSSLLVKISKEHGTNETLVDDDSAKENQELTKVNTATQVRKKGSKQKWVPLDVETIKTDKKKNIRNGKPSFQKDSDAVNSNGEKKKSEKDDTKKTSENNRRDRSFAQRSRGKKRGYSLDWKLRRR